MTIGRLQTSALGIVERYGPFIAAVGVLLGLALTVFALTRQDWVMSDGAEYVEAAERLRNGEPLFVPSGVGERSYRYSPWFAFAWMLVNPPDWLWLGFMAVCAVLAVLPAIVSGGWLGIALGALIFPYLLIAAMGGHVQPALIALLVYGVGRRWGPIAIAIAASLKLAPILYVGVFLARREWGHAATTLVLSALLLAPYLFVDLTHFPTSTEGAWGLFTWSPVLWAVVCVAVGALVLYRPSWFSGSLLVTLAIPKFVYYDVAYLLVSLDRRVRS